MIKTSTTTKIPEIETEEDGKRKEGKKATKKGNIGKSNYRELYDIQDGTMEWNETKWRWTNHRDRRDIYNHLEGFSLLYVKRISFLL